MMTREEAIDCLNGIKIYLRTKHIDGEAVDMAIEALKAKTDGDLISRQDAIDALTDFIWVDYSTRELAQESAEMVMGQVPSAEPKTGEWINRSMNICYPEWERYTCSECGKHSYIYDYCPNCGARMKGADDECCNYEPYKQRGKGADDE